MKTYKHNVVYLARSPLDNLLYIGVKSFNTLREWRNYNTRKTKYKGVLFEKTILSDWATRKLAKQTSTGFDTTGVSSWNKGIPRTKAKLRGRVVSAETI